MIIPLTYYDFFLGGSIKLKDLKKIAMTYFRTDQVIFIDNQLSLIYLI